MIKKAIIIGASSGIGRGLAKELVSHNYKVGITGRRKQLLDELASEKPENYIVKSFDITKHDQIYQNLEDLVSELGGLDLLVISSSIIKYNIELDFAIEKTTIDTNIRGFTCVVDWGFNYFRAQKSGQLLGITSVAGFRGWRNNPSYNSSKAYQMTYLESLRNLAHYEKLPITVTDVRPGYVKTPMMGKSYVFWVSSVAKVARQIYKRAIVDKRKVVYVSKRWALGAFIYKALPKRLIERA